MYKNLQKTEKSSKTLQFASKFQASNKESEISKKKHLPLPLYLGSVSGFC